MRRARSVIAAAVELGRGRALFLVGLAAAIFVPLGLINAAVRGHAEIDPETMSGLEITETLLEIAGNTASVLLGSILYAGAVAIAVVHAPPGSNPSLRGVVSRTRWRTLIAIDVLFALGTAFGMLLLIIPGLVFYARYVLAATVAEIEDIGVRGGFRRAAELTRGSRRLVLGLLLAVEILDGMVSGAGQELLEELGATSIVAGWLASSGGDLLFNPATALISVALVLTLGGRVATGGEPGSPAPARD